MYETLTVRAKEDDMCIRDRGLSYKLTGIRKFTWDEVCQLHKVFFSDLDKDKLMSEN